MTNFDPTQRFTSRADDYAKHRPDYPREIIPALQKLVPLNESTHIADIGSGTGIFTKLLLETGSVVYGVEPNEAMRKKAEISLGGYPNFRSVNGQAETTTLDEQCVNLITVAQAFHWFNSGKTLREFGRILKRNGFVVLVWNARIREEDPFSIAYESFLLNFCSEYHPEENMEYNENLLRDALAPITYTKITFPNSNLLNWEGLSGRLLSASYTPTPDHPSFSRMMTSLKTIFQQFQQSGVVTIEYETKMYYFQLPSK